MQWDVFLSYARADRHRAGVLAASLQSRGLRVFVDDAAIEDFSSITSSITDALSRSKVLLALYSSYYPGRRACQWELTYAFVAGQREGDPLRRVLVVNPEASADHVHPFELRDARHWPWPTSGESLRQLTDRVSVHVSNLDTAMGYRATPSSGPDWLPAPAHVGNPRFTGRLSEQWLIHSSLLSHRTPLMPGRSSRIVQVRGMAGIGKSVLAQEYALRFGPAFPGGVFWFDLHTARDRDAKQTMAEYADQVATACAALGLRSGGATLPRLLSRLAVVMGERGRTCLWVVDGVPAGLSQQDLHLLRGPHLLTSTLVTTRSLLHPTFAPAIDLTPLPEQEALRLLTFARTPHDAAESAAAVALTHDVGGHPEALNALADRAAHSDFTELRRRLHSLRSDLLALTDAKNGCEGMPFTWPLTGDQLHDDVLRLLALACPAPLSETAIEAILGSDDDRPGPLTGVRLAIEQLLGQGQLLPEPMTTRSWGIHPLIARAVRRHDPDPGRQEDLRRFLLYHLAAPTTTPETASSTHQHHSPLSEALALGLASPREEERTAAYNLQVELVTRIGYQRLAQGQGSLREALTSLHSLFEFTRGTLHGIALTGTPTSDFPLIATTLLNRHLRPFLSRWHPALQQHEAQRPAAASPTEHEQNWPRSAALRAELEDLRTPLKDIAHRLGGLCGTDLTVDESGSN
ncbi:tetratricopeptide repeat protein [Streptomyces kronopolitis]|uniref:tetratricopeptide repeat protein n=1 Tax=Streptomyces kronopolitis TaxID=1612435 RepID=UPI001E6295FE|nr:toll/interleukin-1 receptor domain-containing protein [Streptomyces kronopolitis]